MLLCCSLQRPHYVWTQTAKLISEDMFYIPRSDPIYACINISDIEKEQAALKEIETFLRQNGKSLEDFPLMPVLPEVEPIDVTNHLIMQELSYDKQALQVEASQLAKSLNTDQKEIYDKVMSSLDQVNGAFFFVYGCGGTGKTFLWNALTSSLHGRGDIVLTVASSGIAATLLPSGRTAHSRFVIPIQVNELSICGIKQNSPLTHLLQKTKLIIWDEAPMVQRYCVEAVDRTLQDIMHCTSPFGGKCIIMGGGR
ncbi:ATP-dependent DNA helicase PIF1-like [Neltuma alba]|uniref:ATP-dependent DNA helicase PIF1-like n=1 Tax=Neltuma alba TaxID=207710 RepID=UPI0010A2CF2E|nr:ATP-dependent DNA helicase PIF1-like [Prosopis alba]